MISNRFTQKRVQPKITYRHPMMSGAGLASDVVRRGIANIVKPATIGEEAASKPLYPGEQHALLKSHDGKRYVSHNFSGPGSQVDKRIARGDRPVDQLDGCSFRHDVAYNNLSKARKAKQITRDQQVQGVKKAHLVLKTDLALPKLHRLPLEQRRLPKTLESYQGRCLAE